MSEKDKKTEEEQDYNPFDKKKKAREKTTWDVTGEQEDEERKLKAEKEKVKKK